MLFFKRKPKPVILPRDKHTISRRSIDPDALKVLYRLSSLNYQAYLVGGSVRDLLLGRTPKDFDIGTNARPQEIRKNFRNCFLIGKRFRLAHIVYGKKIFETATFRKAPDANAVQDEHGLYQYEDNTFGTPEEDALRRDFTVNGLFYDIKTFSVIDYVGGLKDLEAKVMRCIGDPSVRFREDPVRMMRAVRFAAKLNFDICSADMKAIRKYAGELENASVSRLCEEIQRLFVKGATKRSILLAYELGILKALLPSLAAWLDADKGHVEALARSLEALDAQSHATEVLEPTPAIAMAALYWPMIEEALTSQGKRLSDRYARRLMAEKMLTPAVRKYKFPRAVWMTAVDVIELVPRFWQSPRAGSGRDVRFASHGIYPETFIFAKVCATVEPTQTYHFEDWHNLVERLGQLPVTDQETGLICLKPNPHSRRARRRPKRGKKRGAVQAAEHESQKTPST